MKTSSVSAPLTSSWTEYLDIKNLKNTLFSNASKVALAAGAAFGLVPTASAAIVSPIYNYFHDEQVLYRIGTYERSICAGVVKQLFDGACGMKYEDITQGQLPANWLRSAKLTEVNATSTVNTGNARKARFIDLSSVPLINAQVLDYRCQVQDSHAYALFAQLGRLIKPLDVLPRSVPKVRRELRSIAAKASLKSSKII